MMPKVIEVHGSFTSSFRSWRGKEGITAEEEAQATVAVRIRFPTGMELVKCANATTVQEAVWRATISALEVDVPADKRQTLTMGQGEKAAFDFAADIVKMLNITLVPMVCSANA